MYSRNIRPYSPIFAPIGITIGIKWLLLGRAVQRSFFFNDALIDMLLPLRGSIGYNGVSLERCQHEQGVAASEDASIGDRG